MGFRWKLLFAFGATTVVAVAVVALVATRLVRSSYLRSDQHRIDLVLKQVQAAIERRGEEAMRRVTAASEDDAVTRIGVALNQAAPPATAEAPAAESPGYGVFLNEAGALARAHELELLEIVSDDGTVLSSAQWEARAGYRKPGLDELAAHSGPLIQLEDLPSGTALAVESLVQVTIGARKLYLLGGYRLDDALAGELNHAGVEHAMLFRLGSEGALVPVTTSPESATEGRRPAAESARKQNRRGQRREPEPPAQAPATGIEEALRRVAARTLLTGAEYRGEETSGELGATHSTVAAIPLRGTRGNVLGAFVVTVSGEERTQVLRSLSWAALSAGGLGLLVALLLSLVLAHRITTPVAELVRASRELAAGNLDHRIRPRGDDELARLSRAFNQMAAGLQESRERLVQAERVAAWRELARRLAHELKNPLFPLQLSVENLRRAREAEPEHFDEAFEEGTATLLAELNELKQIVARFSDFARMPQPQLEPTNLNELVERTARLYEPRARQQNISMDIEASPVAAMADPHLLSNALGNLLANAIDALPAGGHIALRAYQQDGRAVMEVADNGPGLDEEQRQRLFTPYFTTKKQGTGLGLAIVQSVVADHHGRITVESAPQQGTRFRIELPLAPATTGQPNGTQMNADERR